MHSVKNHSEFDPTPFTVHHVSNNIYVAPVQVETPFFVSTAKWLKGGCDKDVTKFHSVQRMYKDDGQAAHIEKIITKKEPFRYFIVAKETSPQINFTVEGEKYTCRM